MVEFLLLGMRGIGGYFLIDSCLWLLSRQILVSEDVHDVSGLEHGKGFESREVDLF